MDNAIKWSSVGAVGLLAAVAGWISYTHALDVVRLYRVPQPIDYAYPATVDGLIYVASMVLLDIARRRAGRSYAFWLAWGVLGLGVLVTGAVNAWAGLPYGPWGAVIYAWPAVALVLSYELLMLLIRNAAQEPASAPKGVRQLMKEHKVGYDKAKALQASMNGGTK